MKAVPNWLKKKGKSHTLEEARGKYLELFSYMAGNSSEYFQKKPIKCRYDTFLKKDSSAGLNGRVYIGAAWTFRIRVLMTCFENPVSFICLVLFLSINKKLLSKSSSVI